MKIRLLTYHRELADIHVHLLGLAVRRLMRHRPGAFLPEIYEVRRSAACALRNLRAGLPALCAPSEEPQAEPNVERSLERAPRPGQPFHVAQLAPGAAPARLGAGK